MKQIWLHHFSDASQEEYGQVSYLRIVNSKNEIHCCFLMGKTRFTLRKFTSISHLELTAAVLLAKCHKFIKKDLQLECTHKTFWTDIKVVIGYIQNNTKRFENFVANRIHQTYLKVVEWNNGDMYHQNIIQLTIHHMVWE